MSTKFLRILTVPVLALVLVLFLAPSDRGKAEAQGYPQYNIFAFNQPPSAHALAVFKRVKTTLGVPESEVGIAANRNVPNALAAVMGLQKMDQYGRPVVVAQKVVLYNPAFMTQLEVSTDSEWAGISIIAHEVGHHLGNHVTPRTHLEAMRHPWQMELEADYFSGLALAKLGAKSEDLQRAQRLMFSTWGSPTHPDTVRRIQAINKGWIAGGGQGQVTTDLMAVWKDIQGDLTRWWK